MFTRIIYAAPLVILLSIFSASHAVFAQSYHHVISHIEENNGADSAEALHLQISIHQPDKKNLRFRVAVLNPDGKKMLLSIINDADVFYYETAKGQRYYNTFNLSQLDDGDYKFVVSDGKEKIIKKIHLKTTDSSYRQVSIQ